MREETLYEIALTQMRDVNLLQAKTLVDHFGSAKALWETPDDELREIGAVGSVLADIQLRDDALRRAEEEMLFIDRQNIDVIPFLSPQYPARLKECADAPLVLYRCGRCPLSQPKMVAIVGTRQATSYGKTIVDEFVRRLAEIDKNVVIVSGLAYGIDIAAHSAALKYGLQTIGVVAHGLDMIYPTMHRREAAKMANTNGAILTEFPSRTQPLAQNFLQRNRIVAGLCHAVIVVESDFRGGSLSTARLAVEYGRELFAVPGRITDKYSTGCNNLIAENRAGAFTTTEDFMKCMGWMAETQKRESKAGVQYELKFDSELSPEKRRVLDILSKHEEMQINELATVSGMPIAELLTVMTELAFDDMVLQKPGDVYQLCGKIQTPEK